jgi:peptide/nickel transport system substrate-binding protein
MKRRRSVAVTAVCAVGAVVLAACSSSSSSSTSSVTGPSYGQAITSVVNPSAAKGGTITFDNTNVPDSTDPGNTYYAYMWNFTRLYAMPLMTYVSTPGSGGLQVVPDLATGPGVVGDNGLTWTYTIKPNVKFEDGTLVTSQDVKYAVERTFAKNVLPNGPSYFQVLLGGNAATYPGPYTDRSKNVMGLTAVTTPNSTTVVFHLAKPFADFNYVAAIPQTAPVPPDKDTGANYQLHPISTGPYMFQSYQLNKQFTLVPNPNWNPATDPQAGQLASKIIVNLNVNANDIDNRLLAGDIQMDMAGTGVQAAARAHILSSPSLMKQADDPISGFMWFAYINTKVAPLNNVACRRAVEYAADKVTMQDAYGGPVAGGTIASTAMPPNVVGYQSFDMYDALSQPNGDVTQAKQELATCGQPNGFTTSIAYRADRPKEVAAATALQAALATVGIKATLKGYPSGTYYSNFAGSPAYVHSHDLGIDFGGWAADWPDGWGWFDEIANGNAIVPAGNTNISELNDPVVNSLLAQMQQLGSTPASRATLANQIDHQVMSDAVMLPIVYAKSLLYRSPSLTNVFVQSYYGMYNYATLGTK